MVKAVRTYLRLDGPKEFREVLRLLDILGLRQRMHLRVKAGWSAGYDGGTGQIELYAPARGSSWIGPPGDADFAVRVHDSETAYKRLKRNGYKIVSDAKDPKLWASLLKKPPRGLSREQIEQRRTRVMDGQRSFMVEAGGRVFFVDSADSR